MNKKRPKPRTVELVRSSYQPTKAEKKEEITLDITGDTVLARMENLAKAMLSPVKPRWIDKPRSRR